MAKRSIRAFLRALKEQINAETRKLDEMAAERDRIIMKEQQKVAVQFSKVEALKTRPRLTCARRRRRKPPNSSSTMPSPRCPRK
jgi:hypothetical protein